MSLLQPRYVVRQEDPVCSHQPEAIIPLSHPSCSLYLHDYERLPIYNIGVVRHHFFDGFEMGGQTNDKKDIGTDIID
eukprot:scaffold1000_cov166-Amphora_coffeaeformis.AAC.27